MKEAWVKFLANVSDKELARYIGAWERSINWYEPGSNAHGSTSRALAGAYRVRDSRRKDDPTIQV